MAEHSICQPGRPGPQGLGHAGSPDLACFHSAKSAGDRFLAAASPPSPFKRINGAVGQFAVLGIPGHVEKDVPVRFVGKVAIHQGLSEGDDLVHRFRGLGHFVDLIDAQALPGY